MDWPLGGHRAQKSRVRIWRSELGLRCSSVGYYGGALGELTQPGFSFLLGEIG